MLLIAEQVSSSYTASVSVVMPKTGIGEIRLRPSSYNIDCDGLLKWLLALPRRLNGGCGWVDGDGDEGILERFRGGS